MTTIQTDNLRDLILKLSRGRTVQDIVTIVRSAARNMTGADGATFILKDRDKCYYVDEDAIAPLWKGKKFPLEACVSGWAMLNKSSTVVKDIYKDPRVPIDAYRPTFVKSLAMVPINIDSPFGAIGNYWSVQHEATEDELLSIVSEEIHDTKPSGLRISDELEKFGQLISDIGEIKGSEAQRQKLVYEISLKQLHEMNGLLKNFLEVQAL